MDHYAGLVAYACEALMDKNKDFVIAEHQTLMTSSRFPLVQYAPGMLHLAQQHLLALYKMYQAGFEGLPDTNKKCVIAGHQT